MQKPVVLLIQQALLLCSIRISPLSQVEMAPIVIAPVPEPSPTPPWPSRSDRHNDCVALIDTCIRRIRTQFGYCISHRLDRIEPSRIRLDVDDRDPTAQVSRK